MSNSQMGRGPRINGKNHYNPHSTEFISMDNPPLNKRGRRGELLCGFCPKPARTTIERMFVGGRKLVPVAVPWCAQC